MTIAPRPFSLAVVAASFVFVLFPSLVSASHSWGPYHWSTEKLPLQLVVGDNLTIGSPWDTGYFLRDYVITPWNRGCEGDVGGTLDSCRGAQPSGEAGKISSQVELNPVSSNKDPSTCFPTLGRVEVCNYTYGDNGWLGIAQIWTKGPHIQQAVAKLNDTYFNQAPYSANDWRALVICQEVGHTFGLDHQDENFGNPNLGTCMDYTGIPGGTSPDDPNNPANVYPNYHDFEQLILIYHTHTPSGGGSGGGKGGKGKPEIPPAMYENLNDRAKWGVLRRETNNGRTALYDRDLGGGQRLFTFVIWAR